MPSITAFAGSVPANYDQYLGPLFFEPYALDLLKRIKLCKPEQVLELACGTGRVTRHLANLLRDSGQLYATDLNPEMMKLAQQKITEEWIKWMAVDAQDIPFKDDYFDLVVCQFGVMFFPDKQKAFNEIYRVLAKGGQFIFSTWDDVPYNAATLITQQVLNDVFKEDPPDFIKKGPFSFFNKEQIRRLLEQSGFKEITIEVVSLEGIAPTPDFVTNGYIDGSPLTGYLHERAVPIGDIKGRIKDILIQQFGANDLKLPMQALVISAVK